MNDNWTSQWNERYNKDEFAYGEIPNEYFKEQLEKLPAGSILMPAEGEGRNGIFAATLGWTVSAFDISSAGRDKALILAEKKRVSIDYQVGELEKLNYKPGQFDAIGLIYAHFPPHIKSSYHKVIQQYLRKGGTVIFEAFSKNHLAYRSKNERVGGPNNLDSLFSIAEIKSDFQDFEIIELTEKEVMLNEGILHNGVGSVIRFVGVKK